MRWEVFIFYTWIIFPCNCKTTIQVATQMWMCIAPLDCWEPLILKFGVPVTFPTSGILFFCHLKIQTAMSQSSSGTEISYSWSSDKNKLPSVLSILFRVLSDSKIFRWHTAPAGRHLGGSPSQNAASRGTGHSVIWMEYSSTSNHFNTPIWFLHKR